jgi:hypothetical protein
MAEGAYAANTLRAQEARGAIFQAFCARRASCFFRRIQPGYARLSLDAPDIKKDIFQETLAANTGIPQ